MSKQTRLNTEQAIALLEHSDEGDDWANSENEEDADDTYQQDPLEIAEWEADEGEESLLSDSASDRQHTDACSQVTTDTGTETTTITQSENHDQQINDGNTQINTGDVSQSINGDTNVPWETSHTPGPTAPTAPFSPLPFTDQAGPQHTLPGNASVLGYRMDLKFRGTKLSRITDFCVFNFVDTHLIVLYCIYAQYICNKNRFYSSCVVYVPGLVTLQGH